MLHFELCYYRLIEYAIAHGLVRFEGGAGGEQKLKRGLLPQRTFSAHWFRHPALGHAIAEYVKREARAVDEEMRLCQAASPFARTRTSWLSPDRRPIDPRPTFGGGGGDVR